jgi:hypothetical protein
MKIAVAVSGIKRLHWYRDQELALARVAKLREALFGQASLPKTSETALLNEFYKKGCQEKSSTSTGGVRLFLEIQPTVFRYL